MFGNAIGLPFIRSGVSYDADAESFFTRAGITNTTEKSAWDTFVLALKANSLWTPCIAFWGCSPTSYGASLHNLKSSSYLLSTSAAPSFSTNGWQFNGSTQFLQTGLIASAVLSIDDFTFGVRSRTNSENTGIDFGVSSSTSAQIFCQLRKATNTIQHNTYTNATSYTGTNTDSSGNYFFGTIASNDRYIRKGTSSLATSAVAHGSTNPTHEFYIGARNNVGTADQFSSRELSGAWMFEGLTTGECDTLNGLIDTLNANIVSGGR